MNEVLCIYDTRNIQRYIFSPGSEEAQIGAGILVTRILPEGLEAALKSSGLSEREHRLDYASDPDFVPFLDNEYVKAELISVGGGNAIMLYRNLELCRRVNRLFSRYVLEHTYTLQIDLGVIPKTDSFSDDINRIYRQANVAKSRAVTTRPMGGLPIVQVERETLYPLSALDPETGEKISMDNFFKRGFYPAKFSGFYRQGGIAYVHIDGNEVSLNVNNIMNAARSYREGIASRRRISEHITRTYQAALDDIERRLSVRYGEAVCKYFQVLNFGGDDINLRCSKDLALEIAVSFSDFVSGQKLWPSLGVVPHVGDGPELGVVPHAGDEPESGEVPHVGDGPESGVVPYTGDSSEMGMVSFPGNSPEPGVVPFSVSVGIAYVSGDVSFYQGQRMAAKCCDNAKMIAKRPDNRVDGFPGNWMDYCVYETSAPENLPGHPCQIPGRADL